MKILTTSVLPPTHPYLINKYTLWYYSIIDHARQRDTISEYTETHHIIPDCFYINNRSKGKRPGFLIGNSNDKNNLVDLTFKEHFICHWLLTKMVTGSSYYKMERAMCGLRTSSARMKF